MKDKDAWVLRILKYLDEKTYSESGGRGLLGNAPDEDTAIMVFDRLKKLLQRLEWWPEQDPREVMEYALAHGVSAVELVWMVRAVTLHDAYVLGRLDGSKEPVDFFEKGRDEAAALAARWDNVTDKICFITCCNNDTELEEMYAWIARLYVPAGMEVETLEVRDAGSMCAGYNEAMHSSDAKYKVYMHQDVRILNPYFIYDLLDCFASNPQAGMVGMFGAERVPESGIMWETERFGAVIHTEYHQERLMETFSETRTHKGDFAAALLDGFLMATRIDLVWREDVFTGWDFYDASQSMEFYIRGYKLIVPEQKVPWCLHDFGMINWDGYDESRLVFLGIYTNAIVERDKGLSCKEALRKLLNEGSYERAYELVKEKLREEIHKLKEDVEYCILAASAALPYDRGVALDVITMGLSKDPLNYELYLLLGEYFEEGNMNQALLCFYQAMYYCEPEEDRGLIMDLIGEMRKKGACIRKVSIVVLGGGDAEATLRCVASVRETVPEPLYELIVIDDLLAPDDPGIKMLQQVGIKHYCNMKDWNHSTACNAGIKRCSSGNDLFILDSQSLLIDNAFFYLQMGLYADDRIGAVGGVTNDYIIDQRMYIDLSNFEEAARKAGKVNTPLRNPYEDSIYVSSFAMMLRCDVPEKTGFFDEGFSLGSYAVKDYCVRIHLAGFRVIQCYNSYILLLNRPNCEKIMEEGNYEKSAALFKEKWKCNIDYSNNARAKLIEMIHEPCEKKLEVLELGCAMGSSLNRIRRIWSNATTHGIEFDGAVARIGASITDIIQGDVETMEIPYKKKQFDYIICADVLEHLREPESTIRRFLPYLKEDGYFLISIPNVRHYTVVLMLALFGRFDYTDDGILDRTHLRFFTKDTAVEMLQACGLEIVEMQRNYNVENGGDDLINKLGETFGIEEPEELKVFQYYFLARRERG